MSNSNDDVTQAEVDAAALIVNAEARNPTRESSTDGDGSASPRTAAPNPGTSEEPIVLGGSSAPPPASTVVPDTAARAALTAQIEEAIRKTCAEWDEKNAGGRMLNMDEVRDLMMMRTAEANHGAAVLSSKGCVNAMSVPLPPK